MTCRRQIVSQFKALESQMHKKMKKNDNPTFYVYVQCRGKAKTLLCESLVYVYPSVCARERALCSRVHHGVPALTWAEETYGKSQRSGLRWRRRQRCARARATIISRRAPAALRKQQKQEFAGFGPTEKKYLE